LKETIGRLPPEGVGATSADVLWARFLRQGGWWQGAARPEALQPQATAALNVAAPQFQGDEQTYPYFLHLYLSPFLSDGRGASLPWLQGVPDPMTTLAWQTWVEIHPSLAQKLGVGYGDIVQVTSPAGQIEVPVYIYRAIRPDTAAIPIGQGHTDEGRYARDRGANPLQLLGAQPGPSGDLAWAGVRVKLAPTGRHVPLAVFESLEGTSTGFINKNLPGQ
jgi:anaerobic selenocysteine-containing dehydrogenase